MMLCVETYYSADLVGLYVVAVHFCRYMLKLLCRTLQNMSNLSSLFLCYLFGYQLLTCIVASDTSHLVGSYQNWDVQC